MPFVMFLSGIIMAFVVVVAGAALVLVWTIAYGTGRYCRQLLKNAQKSPQGLGLVIHLRDKQVS
ncbi:hypothetical protein [Sulfobacillus thermosulfidooxidans]|uniref:hypothetical protein n=1 Tax=Sulfobacillus thermosulfidooxidans TaxID=28034 RepID=UPI00096BA76D|nr:hypothetical protein [Sulfobacillus thermosulfidooxidans]OLZ08162.1 hypothetical protein BFX05_05155 [Sulfobacillus thermosulfidooxidans]OLZ14978.1 hypothetical protein BFX06_05095 [Sulfobacillus thermosulfidooxidans]OLZ19663.1 hypothetical protein BFX07_03115 [Sulfobacillus thermosulfidooxidans]